MYLKPTVSLCLLLLCAFSAFAQEKQYVEDFDFFWRSINDNYAYFDKKTTDWAKVKEIYGTQLSHVKDKAGFIRLLELTFRELYDDHSQLNTNLPDSSRLVPSGSDLRAEWSNSKAVVTDIRQGFGAARVGMKVGMEIATVNGETVENAIRPFIGRSLRSTDLEARNWALNTILAGDHATKRFIEARSDGKTQVYKPDEPQMLLENISYPTLLDHRVLDDEIGYIRINNSLGDNNLIGQFDDALDGLMETKGLILDLRETPSGGNSTVARAIMSRFIRSETPYQKHSDPTEERQWGVKRSWFEIVSPRGVVYNRPLVILVNAWTGSMGEGIAIGFDGMKRSTIVGKKMASLNGAMTTFELPNTKIKFSFPTEKIFHINGQARENFIPTLQVDKSDIDRDSILLKGIEELKKKLR